MKHKHTFLVSTRSIDRKGHFASEPGTTLYLKVPHSLGTYSPDQSISRDRWRKSVMAAADGVEDDITGSTGDILVFVHGYNNDIEVVLKRTRLLQQSLLDQGWKGLVIGFDWPSANSTLNYLEDRSDASQVAVRLVQESLDLLIEGQVPTDPNAQPCKLNVHLLGHSTGAYVIMEAFAQAAKIGGYFKSPWRIGQVAFIGGDVATDSLSRESDWSAPMFNRILRLTNYSNAYDKVLGVSNAKRLGTAPRAGRVGLPTESPRKAVNVDCSEYFATKDPKDSNTIGTFCHSWHIGDPVFALDLAMTLEGGIDRNGIPTRDHTSQGLVLRGGRSRPPFQAYWDLDNVSGVST